MTISGYEFPALGDIGTFLIGAAAVYGAYQAYKAKHAAVAANTKVDVAVAKIEEVQKQTNGMSHVMQEIARKEGRQEKADELLAETAAAKVVARDEALKDAQSAADVANVAAKEP